MAQYRLAEAYFFGEGVAKDPARIEKKHVAV